MAGYSTWASLRVKNKEEMVKNKKEPDYLEWGKDMGEWERKHYREVREELWKSAYYPKCGY